MYHFIRNSKLLKVQKVTSKELYWILITKIEHKPTSQKYFEKKITDLRLERYLHDNSHCFQQHLYKVFSVQSFEQCTFSK